MDDALTRTGTTVDNADALPTAPPSPTCPQPSTMGEELRTSTPYTAKIYNRSTRFAPSISGRSRLIPELEKTVGEVCPALAAAHKRYRVYCSAFIAACNPFSQLLDDEANAEPHVALGQELVYRGLASIEGIGQHPSNQWPGEASYLIFGLTLDAAKTLGTRLEQNAIVQMGADAAPQLRLLR